MKIRVDFLLIFILHMLRTVFFLLILSLSAVLHFLLTIFICPFLSFPVRYRFVNAYWCQSALWLSRIILGISFRVEGYKNIPNQPCIIVANHQSTWETIFLSACFQPLGQVIKRELLYIPFFGWALAILRPIAINRSNPRESLKKIYSKGSYLLRNNTWVLIFPEGTRVLYGSKLGSFSKSAASLAIQSGVPILPIAHNAGKFWPKNSWVKTPGIIQVVIGEPMYPSSEGSIGISELTKRAKAWHQNEQISMRSKQASDE